jgi:hypothetical protein
MKKIIGVCFFFITSISLSGQIILKVDRSEMVNECTSELIYSSKEGTMTIDTDKGIINIKTVNYITTYWISKRRMHGKYVQYKIAPDAMGYDAILTFYKDKGYMTIAYINPEYDNEVLLCDIRYIYIKT